jgi:hypothetical protein
VKPPSALGGVVSDDRLGRGESGDTDDFVDAGNARSCLVETILAQRAEAGLTRDRGGLVRRQPLQNRLAQRRDHLDHLIDRQPALVAGAEACRAADRRMPSRRFGPDALRHLGEVLGDFADWLRRRHGARGTQLTHQPLRQDTAQPGDNQVWFEAHVDQPGEGGNGIVGVEC